MEAKGKVERARGRAEGMLEATSKMPNGPRPSRDNGDTPTNSGLTLKDQILAQAFKN